MADALVADLGHYLNDDGELTHDIGPAWSIAAYLTSIVGWVTSRTDPDDILTNLHCRRRPNHTPCGGEIVALLLEGETAIVWGCPECNDAGVIYGWEDTRWDRGERMLYEGPFLDSLPQVEDEPIADPSASPFGRFPEAQGALWRAQDLVYEAAGSPSRRKREELARRALEIFPDCSDAYLILSEAHAISSDERFEYVEKAFAAAKRALGPEPFEDGVGHFWSLFETRPYMRARLDLAIELALRDRLPEAVNHCKDLLRLNPEDQQAVRYHLVLYLMILEDTKALKALFKRYPDDAAAPFLYGHALFLYRTEGPGERANHLLGEALDFNPHVPAYLLGRRKVQGAPPNVITLGADNEALAYAFEWKQLWRDTPGALKWLRGQVENGLTRVK